MAKEIGKDTCPICFEPIKANLAHNCLQCMTCNQQIHAMCEMTWNKERKPTNRVLRDDILICPVCNTDSIAYCGDLPIDINTDLKEAVMNNQGMKGGKINKKSKKNKKSRKQKTKKGKKYQKPKRNKTTRKHKKSRKY
jgi:hypothetical protein